MNNVKKVLGLGMAILAIAFVFSFSAPQAEAAATTCTAVATGLWSAATTWDATCNTDDASIPDADDAVVIPGNFIVTVSSAGAVAASVSISNPVATGNNGITIASPGTLAVGGAVTIVGSSGASNSAITVADGSLTATGALTITAGASTGNSTVSVTSGSLSVASVAITDGASTADAALTLTTGSITTTGASGIAFTVTNIADTILTISSTGTLTLQSTGSLGAGGTISFNAGSTEAFTGAAQTVNTYTYGNLTLSGSGIKTVGGTTIIGGTLTITPTATASLTAGLNTAHGLNVNGVTVAAGTWGSTGSSATFKNNDAFTGAATGLVTVATGGNTHHSGSGSTVTYTSTSVSSSNDSSSSSDDNTDTTSDNTTTEDTTPAVVPGCSAGNTYNTSTGALCVSAVAHTAIEGCADRNTGFSTTSGNSCVGNTVSAAATSKTYNFGTVTLKNGSQGDAVMELQRFLNAKLNLGLVIDGKLGPKTIAVIKTWQAANGLVADGLVGAMTKAKMNASVQ